MDLVIVYDPAPGPPALTVTNTATPTIINSGGGGGTTNVTFSAQSIGTAAADREVYVAVTNWKSGTPGSINSCTIGGTAATEVTKSTTALHAQTAIYKRTVTSGTTADIVVNVNAPYSYVTISVYRVTGRASEAASSNQDSTASITSISTTVNVPAGGAVIACAQSGQPAAGGPDLTPTGFTQDHSQDAFNQSPNTLGSATGLAVETPRTLTGTLSSSTTSNGMAISAVALG